MTEILPASHKFVFSTGACQPPDSFVMAEMALAAGPYQYESLTPDTRFNVSGTTYQAGGHILATAVEGFVTDDDASVTIVGHSNGANAALWAAAELEQCGDPDLFKKVRVLLVNGGLDPSLVSLSLGRPLPAEVPPAKNTQYSRKAIIAAPGYAANKYMTIFNKHMAAGLLYKNASPDIAQRLIWALRPHYRPPARFQPLLEKFPDVPIDSMVTIDDPVVKHQFQTYRDRVWFGIKSDPLINADHSPHISMPQQFAAKLGEIARRPPQPTLAMKAATAKDTIHDSYWETFNNS